MAEPNDSVILAGERAREMIIAAQAGFDPQQLKHDLTALGLWVTRLQSAAGECLFLVSSFSAAVDADQLAGLPGVAAIYSVESTHPLIDASAGQADVAGIAIGPGAPPVLMAGPCSVESREQIERIARRLAPMGVQFLRGGAFKPRSSPYSFQGHGREALRWMHEAARAHDLRVVTEAISERDVPDVAEWADLIQIGSRNMQNFALLKTVGSCGKPVLLKRGVAASVEEWFCAAEYLRVAGSSAVIFCERGIRGFDNTTRYLLDVASVALLSHVHRLPVIVDPSHAAGRRDLVLALAQAALAAGTAGLLIEVHDQPEAALSDGPQALQLDQMERLAGQVLGWSSRHR